MKMCSFYRPQRSWGKVIFSQASVILITGGGGLPQCMLGYHSPPSLWDQAGPPRLGRPPDQAGTPARPGRHPGQTRQAPLPPGPGRHTPQSRAYLEIRSTSGRYASYWNAILLPSATKLGQGYIFTGICDSFHRYPPPPEQAGRQAHPPPPTRQAGRPPPRRRAYLEIRSTSRPYASYWNTILLEVF